MAQKKQKPVVTSSAFGRPISQFQLLDMGDQPGFPDLKSKKRPWQGLGTLFSETIGPIPRPNSIRS